MRTVYCLHMFTASYFCLKQHYLRRTSHTFLTKYTHKIMPTSKEWLWLGLFRVVCGEMIKEKVVEKCAVYIFQNIVKL